MIKYFHCSNLKWAAPIATFSVKQKFTEDLQREKNTPCPFCWPMYNLLTAFYLKKKKEGKKPTRVRIREVSEDVREIHIVLKRQQGISNVDEYSATKVAKPD